MLKLQVIIVVFFVSLTHCSPFEATVNYRLPNDTVPLSYDLLISTDIHQEDFTFSGRVKIHIRVKETTQIITLHCRDIIVNSVNLYDSNGALKKSKLEFDYLTELEFIKINLQAKFNAQDEIFLDISYTGTLTDETNGFFKTFYTNREFKQEWIALTNFMPISARKAFICYDEPQIKTPFKLQIRHDKAYHAISNMPVNRTITNGSYVTTIFEETPPMQTYLLTFIVSTLDYVSDNRKDLEQRVYGEPDKIKNGTGNFALKVVGEILDKYKELFNITIQIPKLDHVAIPSISGATEHFGLITYEDTYLLINENYNQLILDYFKPIIIGLISHETSHQYFGNLVTHNWWSYLWLSEGFATFYQYYLPHFLYPQYNFMEKFRTEVLNYAFIIDDYNEIVMNDYVQSPIEIQMKFHPVSFEKSAAVIRMFFEAIGGDVFNEGIIEYLSENKFGITTPNDLHKALQSAYDKKYKNNQLDIGKMMSSWENQAGYPVVSVTRVNKTIFLKQKKFNDHDSKVIFSIPLTLTTQSTAAKSTQLWMTSQSLEMTDFLSSDDEWIIFNVQQVGYYRMDYSRELWRSIIRAYPDGMQRINREILHEEMFIAHQTLKTMTMCDCVRLMSVLRYETEGAVWEKAEYIDKLNQFMLFSDIYPHFRGLLRDILEPHMHILGDTPTVDTSLLNQVTKWSKMAQHDTYLQHELDKLLKYMLSNEENDKPDFCSAFRIANASIYNFYVDELVHFESFIDMELVFGIGCSLDATLLSGMFEEILDDENEISHWMVMDILRATVEASEVGLEAVMDLITNDFDDLKEL